MSPIVRLRLVVHGRVQGVWFRESTRRAAERHAVAGWARNRSDGTVEIVLEGSEPDVARVADHCRVGPTDARVTRVDETAERPEGLIGFAVR